MASKFVPVLKAFASSPSSEFTAQFTGDDKRKDVTFKLPTVPVNYVPPKVDVSLPSYWSKHGSSNLFSDAANLGKGIPMSKYVPLGQSQFGVGLPKKASKNSSLFSTSSTLPASIGSDSTLSDFLHGLSQNSLESADLVPSNILTAKVLSGFSSSDSSESQSGGRSLSQTPKPNSESVIDGHGSEADELDLNSQFVESPHIELVEPTDRLTSSSSVETVQKESDTEILEKVDLKVLSDSNRQEHEDSASVTSSSKETGEEEDDDTIFSTSKVLHFGKSQPNSSPRSSLSDSSDKDGEEADEEELHFDIEVDSSDNSVSYTKISKSSSHSSQLGSDTSDSRVSGGSSNNDSASYEPARFMRKALLKKKRPVPITNQEKSTSTAPSRRRGILQILRPVPITYRKEINPNVPSRRRDILRILRPVPIPSSNLKSRKGKPPMTLNCNKLFPVKRFAGTGPKAKQSESDSESTDSSSSDSSSSTEEDEQESHVSNEENLNLESALKQHRQEPEKVILMSSNCALPPSSFGKTQDPLMIDEDSASSSSLILPYASLVVGTMGLAAIALYIWKTMIVGKKIAASEAPTLNSL